MRQEARGGGNTSSGGTYLNGMHICPYFQQIHTVTVNENVHVSVRRNTFKSVRGRFYFYSVCPVMFFFFGEGRGRFLTDNYVIDSKVLIARNNYLKYFTLIGHLYDDVILYYDQNPSGFCFLVKIRAFVFETSLGIPN